MSFLTDSMRVKIYEVAGRLNIADPAWLEKLIKFESKFNPSASNPYSSAKGLIQVMDSTARNVFSESSSLALIQKYPSFDSQMDNVVYPYLKQWKPYNTAQSLYMAVFYPQARFVDPSTTFMSLYQKYGGANWSNAYIAFTKSNGAIKKVSDYVAMVEGTYYIKKGITLLPILVALGYVIYKKGLL